MEEEADYNQSPRYVPRQSSRLRRHPLPMIFESKKDAEIVLKTLREIAKRYDTASADDLRELLGTPFYRYDAGSRGWTKKQLKNADVLKLRNGTFLLDLPKSQEKS